MAIVKAFIHAKLEPHFTELGGIEPRVSYSIFSFDMTKNGYTMVKEIEVEFDEPDYKDVVAGTVQAMREKQAELRDEVNTKVANIEEQIQRLLCIENKPSDPIGDLLRDIPVAGTLHSVPGDKPGSGRFTFSPTEG